MRRSSERIIRAGNEADQETEDDYIIIFNFKELILSAILFDLSSPFGGQGALSLYPSACIAFHQVFYFTECGVVHITGDGML